MSPRREVRERVLQALYAAEMSGCDIDHVISTVLKPVLGEDEVAFNFAVSLLARSMEGGEHAVRLIERHAENWHVSRIAVIDRLLLQMAITEILTFEDIPPKVSINEAIDIAKRYSTSRSGQFINGILDAVLETLLAEGRVHKRGRGLVGMEWNPTGVAAGTAGSDE